MHRTATPSDLPQIVEIYNSTIPSRMVTADVEPVTVESRTRWFQEHIPEHRPLWVVDIADRVAAWLSFSSFYGRPAYAGTVELSVYVHEALRRRGLGLYLLQQAIGYAPIIGASALLGFVFGHNTPSLGLFARAGFSRWGELPKVAVLDRVERDLVILGRHV